MNADPQIQALLERSARRVPVDVEEALDEILRSARRRRIRHASVLGVAASAILVALVAVLPRADRGGDLLQPSPPAGRIATLVRTLSDSRLVGIDLATGTWTELSAGFGTPTWAQWSPDGDRIAFTVEQQDGARYALVVANADGSDPVTVVAHDKAEGTLGPDLVSVAWSPDGTQLAYSGRTPFRGRTVTVFSADGSGERVLDGHWESVAWSPDGASLLLVGWPDGAGLDGRFDLYRARPDGTQLERLTNDAIREWQPSFSPDGSTILFARAATADENDVNLDIYVMKTDGSNVRRITDESSFDGVPVWSPDGEWIAFTSDRDSLRPATPEEPVGLTSIYAMRPDGTSVRLLLDGRGNGIVPLSWTR